ncbi:DUF1524 domain-containing protein [Corynebacterium sp. 3HC-13]|uniref:HNH endonuclease family protein n=1 Tax=Corynebacterium poyangense TaxID=2684405 RepID=UPI001CD018D9|nr:HNH endonuclease family protein [Corynebacterium poyangense]MBZ8177048.1 DUF1524 domain-containing protein [Corynebacterium poyangense]
MRRFFFYVLLSSTVILSGITALPFLQAPSHNLLASPPLTETLPLITILPERPTNPGYQRSAFGEGWSHHLLPGNGAACSTRQLILLDAQREVSSSVPDQDCTVTEGEILDPYSGEILRIGHGEEDTVNVRQIEIDHIFPLAAAWDLGAADWSKEKRIDFANDPVNLVPTFAAWNREKSDLLPAHWLPPDKTIRCDYSRRVAFIAFTWGLSLSNDDANTMKRQCIVSDFLHYS